MLTRVATAMHCNKLQHTATRCNTLQHTTKTESSLMLMRVARAYMKTREYTHTYVNSYVRTNIRSSIHAYTQC